MDGIKQSVNKMSAQAAMGAYSYGIKPLDGFVVAGLTYWLSPPADKMRNTMLVGMAHGFLHKGSSVISVMEEMKGEATSFESIDSREEHTGFGVNLPQAQHPSDVGKGGIPVEMFGAR